MSVSRPYHQIVVQRLRGLGFESGRRLAGRLKTAVREDVLRQIKVDQLSPEELEGTPEDYATEEAEELVGLFARIPDAYRIDPEECTVIAVEVEHTSPLSEEALLDYQDLWWNFDGHDRWRFELLTADRYQVFRHVHLGNPNHLDPYPPVHTNTILYEADRVPRSAAIMAGLLQVPVP